MCCTVKSELWFLRTCAACDSFSIFLIFWANFYFHWSHIWAVFAIYKYMATLKMKSDPILLLRKLKNPWIWILIFRVAKFWLSGLPYLIKGSIDDFLIGVILWSRILKYGNNSQKSSEHNMKTFSLQASCAYYPNYTSCFHHYLQWAWAKFRASLPPWSAAI